MRCETCDILLDDEDNYCRNCGTAVRVASVPVVRQGAQPPALFRSTAAPLATGAAAVAATAILRWALGQAVRGLFADDRPRRDLQPKGRGLARRDPPATAEPPAPGRREMVEIFWYRRSTRE